MIRLFTLYKQLKYFKIYKKKLAMWNLGAFWLSSISSVYVIITHCVWVYNGKKLTKQYFYYLPLSFRFANNLTMKNMAF